MDGDLKHESAYLRAESARPFFQVGHFFRNAVRDNRDLVYLSLYFFGFLYIYLSFDLFIYIYIFDAVISKCPQLRFSPVSPPKKHKA